LPAAVAVAAAAAGVDILKSQSSAKHTTSDDRKANI